MASLPNLANLLADHGFAFFATEGFRKLRHVRERPVSAETRQRMRIGIGHKPCEFEALVGAPHLSPTQEETLLRSEPVFVRRARLALQRFFVGGEGDGQS